MAFMIVPGCTGPNGERLALAQTESRAIVVADASVATSGLWWTLVYDWQSQGFGMINQLSVEQGDPAALGLVDYRESTLTVTTVSGDGGLGNLMTWDVVPGGNALAVRTTLNSALNLNVAGPGPYPPGSPVIAYDGWGGGKPNEVWTFEDVGYGDYPWNYTFAPESAQGLLLSANAHDAGGPLTLQPPGGPDSTASALQLWSAQYVINGITPLGPVFASEELSMALHTLPSGGALFCADRSSDDAWSAWLTGPGPDSGMTVIRSVGNQNLVWNAAGAGPWNPGNPVIAYPWQGGAANEQWIMTYVPHEVT